MNQDQRYCARYYEYLRYRDTCRELQKERSAMKEVIKQFNHQPDKVDENLLKEFKYISKLFERSKKVCKFHKDKLKNTIRYEKKSKFY